MYYTINLNLSVENLGSAMYMILFEVSKSQISYTRNLWFSSIQLHESVTLAKLNDKVERMYSDVYFGYNSEEENDSQLGFICVHSEYRYKEYCFAYK